LSAEAFTHLAYGATFGILLMSIVYTLVRYIYSKEIMYISYCAMQVFSLGYISVYSHLFPFAPFMQEIFLLLATLSAVIFAITFHEGALFPKIGNFKELVINTILLNVVILTAFYHYILFEYLPYTVVYAILFLSVVFNLRSGFKPTIVYVIGWSLLCILLFVFQLKQVYIERGYIDIVLAAFAVEAVLFTISISYKYNLFKNQASDHQNMLFQQSKMAKSGEMIGNITHQFRQPLNNLSYMLINLKNRYESKTLDEGYFHQKIVSAQEQLQFLSKTIDDFKEFYTPAKAKEPFSLTEAIQNSVAVIAPDLKSKGIALDWVFCDDEVILYGKKNELSQVLMALISNASDALNGVSDPKITLRTKCCDNEVKIVVEDNGNGIPNDKIEKIFEPYFTTKSEGSGIGLYLAKMIIEKSFGGKIEVESKVREGTSFTLSIATHH
jgi:signal transduction histidine kinase